MGSIRDRLQDELDSLRREFERVTNEYSIFYHSAQKEREQHELALANATQLQAPVHDEWGFDVEDVVIEPAQVSPDTVELHKQLVSEQTQRSNLEVELERMRCMLTAESQNREEMGSIRDRLQDELDSLRREFEGVTNEYSILEKSAQREREQHELALANAVQLQAPVHDEPAQVYPDTVELEKQLVSEQMHRSNLEAELERMHCMLTAESQNREEVGSIRDRLQDELDSLRREFERVTNEYSIFY